MARQSPTTVAVNINASVASNQTENTMTDSSMPSVIRVNISKNSPIQRRRINFDDYLDNQQTRPSVGTFINNLIDSDGDNRNNDIETSATVKEEREVDQGDGGGVVEEEEVLHNNHLISSRYK